MPESQLLAPYAIRSTDSAGRRHFEQADTLRSPFELDRHRIIECTAFRRLEGKTQVFAPSQHDHFRSRLTHTLEVTSVARTLAVGLLANEYLTESITLAHDLGHPPFGHAGEAALDEIMVDQGGFNHNAHSLRVVEYLEHPFPPFRGLNLTLETLAGLMAHDTPHDVPAEIEKNSSNHASPSVEAQIASVADRIAYNLHDLEDAIGGEMIGLEELCVLTLWREAYDRMPDDYNNKSIHAIRRVILDAMLNDILTDILDTSRKHLASVSSPGQVTSATLHSENSFVAPTDEMDSHLSELENFLMNSVYRNPDVAEMDEQGKAMIRFLFDTYRSNPSAMPDRFTTRVDDQGLDRVICDYIAGMTDRYCKDEHTSLSS